MSRRIALLFISMASIVLPLSMTVVPTAQAVAQGSSTPVRGLGVARSTAATVQPSPIWAGYGDVGGSYHDVEAVWQVPGIPLTTSHSSYAYSWVGLGGGPANLPCIFGTGLEQIGIADVSQNGQVSYNPFWEVIPCTDPTGTLPSSKPQFFTDSNGQELSVEPGDFITASVSLTGGTYSLNMSDNRGTNNTIWSAQKQVASDPSHGNNSAEVIMEDPPNDQQKATPLADFGRVFFDGAFIDGNPIGSTNPVEFVLNPNSRVGVSPIGANGDNFTVNSPTPPVPTITHNGTYTKGELVYANIQYADPGNDAEGFGFVGVKGSGWAKENHPFWNPSYGIVGPNSIAYPFNEECGTPQQFSSYVQFWIYDTALDLSKLVTIHLVC